MAFFRPFASASAPEPNFAGLFRLIDDFDKYSATQNGGQHHHQVRTFTPKFDLRETETAYELHGELPGVEKENVHIEFVDPQTLVVRGKVERTHTAGNPPAGLVEGKKTEAITESADDGIIVDHHSDTASVNSHKATVEDDPEETQNTPATTVAEVAKPTEEQRKPATPKHKYYLVERSVGQFSRSFSFPGRIDPESVSASLNNGILSVTVEKAKKHETKRIHVN